MKKIRTLILTSILLAVATFLPTRVYAEEAKSTLSKEQTGAISQSCDSIKQSLRKLQKTDTKTRSILGGLYEDIISDFIIPLNLRLVRNALPSTTLTELHSSLLSKRQDFAKKFTLYEQSFEALLDIDCQNNPAAFYAKLVETRKTRNDLEQSTEAFRMLLEKHQNAVQALKGTL
ncbi:hypothetical protein IJ090_00960 [Candidatus Saccharibacteria bacterium]|nr:hypothetical protein [Candidatus Saccharibacteria bacterium]